MAKIKVELSEQQRKDKATLAKLQKQFLGYLRKEGPYKFGVLFREIMSKDEIYLEKTYGVDGHYLEGVIEGVFGHEYGYQMTIEEFMTATKQRPGFILVKPSKQVK